MSLQSEASLDLQHILPANTYNHLQWIFEENHEQYEFNLTELKSNAMNTAIKTQLRW